MLHTSNRRLGFITVRSTLHFYIALTSGLHIHTIDTVQKMMSDSDTERYDSNTATHRVQNMPVEPELLFKILNPRNPLESRRRLGKLYWVGWQRVVLSFFLSAFGTTFALIGLGCTAVCDERERGLAFLIIGGLMILPGYYSAVILLQYLRCIRGFHYRDLPGE